MSRPRLLLAEPADFTPAVLEFLRGWAEVTLGPIGAGSLGQQLENFDIVWIRLGHRLREADLPGRVRCRILAVPTTGLDHLDLEACAQAGIQVVSLRGEFEFLRDVRATAEHTVALALALLRYLPAAHASVLGGGWDRDPFRGRELHGRVAGIVGMGRLGRIVAGYFAAFGMKILGYDPRPDFPAEVATRMKRLEELLENADVVSLHVSYGPATHHLLGSGNIARMKPGAVLINTSRGGVVDDRALLSALESRTISGAALDVIEGEPEITTDHPLVRYAASHSNLILTPHLGGNTWDSFAKTETFIARKVQAAWKDRRSS